MKCLRNYTDQLQIGRRRRGRSPILGTSQKNCTPSFLMRTIQSLLGRIGFWVLASSGSEYGMNTLENDGRRTHREPNCRKAAEKREDRWLLGHSCFEAHRHCGWRSPRMEVSAPLRISLSHLQMAPVNLSPS